MAIVGIGTDIVEIARIEHSMSKSERFALRILTPSELAIYGKSQQPARYLAKRFAAKEAAVKALGTGIGNGIGWQHICVVNDKFGAPVLEFKDQFAVLCKQKGVTDCHISLSDEQHYAVATVILENTAK